MKGLKHFNKNDSVEKITQINIQLSKCQSNLKKYKEAADTLKLILPRVLDKDLNQSLQN